MAGIRSLAGGALSAASNSPRYRDCYYNVPIKTRLTPVFGRLISQQKSKKPIRGSATILLVEDEAAVMTVNKAILSHIGYGIVCAGTGQEAMAIICDPSVVFDLVLLDIKLPDMDGTSLLPEIRNHRPQVRIVVCSGYAIDALTQVLTEAGAHGFIQKPFTLNGLAEPLDQVMTATPSSLS